MQTATHSIKKQEKLSKLLIICELTTIDMVQCPDFIAKEPVKYLNQFIKWKKRKGPLCYNTEDFVNWVNTQLLQESYEKIRYLKRDFEPNEQELSYPILHI